MPPKRIDQFEIDRYWDIFTSQFPAGTDFSSGRKLFLDGTQAAPVFRNSRLRDEQLERVWTLADIDNDGRLDFEEFCVAMRLVYDLVNGEYNTPPQQLPDWLVPEGKSHLVQAGRAVETGGGVGETFERPQDYDDDELGGGGLKDGFDWYMPPAQKREYEDIYSSARDGHGYVSFGALSDLYGSLDVPDTDVRSAWNLVNPSADEVLGKDATLAFLHLLRARHDGFRLPRSVPASLRATFEKKDVDFNIDRVREQATRYRPDDNTSSGKKAKFGEGYLTRLGMGGSREKPRGTDFGTKTTEDWEEVRLKKQLREIEQKIEKVETAQASRGTSGARRDTKPALVKRELEQLLDYKRKQLRDLDDDSGTKGGKSAMKALKTAEEDIQTVKEQVEGLEAHLQRREEALADIKRQIAEEKGR